MFKCTTPTLSYKPLQQRPLHLGLQCTQLHPLAGKLLLQRHIVLLLTCQLLLQVRHLLLQIIAKGPRMCRHKAKCWRQFNLT